MKNKTAFLTATWFKTGLIPSFLPMEMGGTYGSFFALFLCVPAIFVARSIGNVLGGTDYGTIIGMILYSIVVVVIFILGLKSVPIAEKLLGLRKDHKGKIRDHDQNCIVIDEVLGMLIAYIPLMSATTQLRWEYFLYAFLLFRFFDIVKFPPTKYFDRIENAFGVMIDDVVAGSYAQIVLSIIIIVFY